MVCIEHFTHYFPAKIVFCVTFPLSSVITAFLIPGNCLTLNS